MMHTNIEINLKTFVLFIEINTSSVWSTCIINPRYFRYPGIHIHFHILQSEIIFRFYVWEDVVVAQKPGDLKLERTLAHAILVL